MNSYEYMLQLLNRYHSGGSEVHGARLAAEMLVNGYTMVRDFIDLKVGPPWVYTAQMQQFYVESDSLVYALLVWHHKPDRIAWRDGLARRIAQLYPKGARILCLGDGIGYDACAIAWASPLLSVVSFEFKNHCSAFAERMIEDLRLSRVTPLHDLEEIPAGSFDVVVCLDVLEHVPAPPEVVANIARYLKPTGHAFISESFGLIEPFHPTHLISNLEYCGRTIGLFESAGLFYRDIMLSSIFCFEKGTRHFRVSIFEEKLRQRIAGMMAVRRVKRRYGDRQVDLARLIRCELDESEDGWTAGKGACSGAAPGHPREVELSDAWRLSKVLKARATAPGIIERIDSSHSRRWKG